MPASLPRPLHFVYFRIEDSFVRRLKRPFSGAAVVDLPVDTPEEFAQLVESDTPVDLFFFNASGDNFTASLALCRLLRTLAPARGGFVVLVGGRPTQQRRDQAQQTVGAYDWLPIPLHQEETQTKLTSLYASRLSQIELENRARQAVEGMTLAQDATIEAIAALVECRDNITGQHALHTRDYIRILIDEVRRLGYYADELTADFKRLVVMTSPLHDIGKVGIKDSILLKPEGLKPDEILEMQTHTTKGGEALMLATARTARSPFLECARDMALYHHEKWDGSGYPEGLNGEDIPLCARLMAVADVYDALRQDRPYRLAWPHERCVAHIRSLSETEFDPAIVEAFCNVADQFALISRQYTAVP